MSLFKRFSAILIVAALLLSCRKPSGANWDVDLVVPVVNSQLNIKNFLGDSLFKSDNSRLLYLNVNRELASIKLDSLFDLPDTSFTQTFTVPLLQTTTVAPGTSLSFFAPSELNFNLGNGIELKQADVRSCLLTVKFSNNVGQPMDFTYVIPNATKGGSVFTIKEVIPPGKKTLIKTYDLAGYSLNLTGLSGKTYNTIAQTYTVGVNAAAEAPAVFTPGVPIAEMELSYSKIIPDFFLGYFGTQSVAIKTDTARLNLSQNFTASNFLLKDATMTFNVKNEIGADFRGSLAGVTAVNSASRKSVVLQTPTLSLINIDAATRAGTQITPRTRTIVLSTGNSNITQFISNIPDKISYEGTVTVNPLKFDVSGHNDFAFYNTGIGIYADINIPLEFAADNFTLITEANVDFSNIKQLDKVKGGNFVIITNNGYPFATRLQAYMINGQGVTIDSLFVNGANTLARGQIDERNIVTSPASSKIYVPVTTDKVGKLKDCKKIKIVSTFFVPPGPPDTKLLEYYEMDINIVAELTYNVGTSN